MSVLILIYGIGAIMIAVIDWAVRGMPCASCKENPEHATVHAWQWTVVLALLWPLCLVLLVAGVGRPARKP